MITLCKILTNFKRLYHFKGKTLKNRPFFRRAPLKNGFFGKNSEIRRQAKKIFDFTLSNALKTPLFRPKFSPWLELGGGPMAPLAPPLRTGLCSYVS